MPSKRKTTNSRKRKKTSENTTIVSNSEKFKKEIISGSERDYDKLFEEKLAEQYKTFRNLREHKIQMNKVVRIIVILAVIALLALLLLSFG